MAGLQEGGTLIFSCLLPGKQTPSWELQLPGWRGRRRLLWLHNPKWSALKSSGLWNACNWISPPEKAAMKSPQIPAAMLLETAFTGEAIRCPLKLASRLLAQTVPGTDTRSEESQYVKAIAATKPCWDTQMHIWCESSLHDASSKQSIKTSLRLVCSTAD